MSKVGMKEIVNPIKSNRELHLLETELKNGFNGIRNFTIWNVSKCLLLRASDTLKLKYNQVFDKNGNVISASRTHDKKTGKVNILDFGRIRANLLEYNQWRKSNPKYINSSWLFPAPRNPRKHLRRDYWYQVIRSTAHWVGLNHIGSHSARKTGAYIVYKKTGNIALVMRLLNQSSERVTLDYLGVPLMSANKVLNNMDFETI